MNHTRSLQRLTPFHLNSPHSPEEISSKISLPTMPSQASINTHFSTLTPSLHLPSSTQRNPLLLNTMVILKNKDVEYQKLLIEEMTLEIEI